jgi:hypothetical protein
MLHKTLEMLPVVAAVSRLFSTRKKAESKLPVLTEEKLLRNLSSALTLSSKVPQVPYTRARVCFRKQQRVNVSFLKMLQDYVHNIKEQSQYLPQSD